MEKQSISRDNLKKIYDIACGNWKTKLENYAKRNPFHSEIEFTKAEIDEMFSASDSNQKAVLGEYFKQPLDIRSKIKSFKDACDYFGVKPESVYNSTDTKDEIGYKKLKLIIKALNEGWYPNWKDENERKWFNYFNMSGVFAYYATYYNYTDTYVPSALYLKNRELAEHCAKIALEEYKDYHS